MTAAVLILALIVYLAPPILIALWPPPASNRERDGRTHPEVDR